MLFIGSAIRTKGGGYKLYFDKVRDIALAIEKTLITENGKWLQDAYRSKYADMRYRYGEPIIMDAISSVRRLKGYIITLAWEDGAYVNGVPVYSIKEFYEQVFE